MVSGIDLAERALVSLLSRLAVLYSVVVGVTRETSDAKVRRAYRKLSKKCHPDRSGKREHQQSLNSGCSAWEDAHRIAKDRASTKSRRQEAATRFFRR